MSINNPILAGFNPDPSICYVDGIYYIAVSTFEFFPGATLYKSTDLKNWEYIGSALTRESQLDLIGCKNSSGIYAPTLRYHEGTFYLVTTNKHKRMNFMIVADSITGPWSEPMLINSMGIDPSLFFDEDGSCFYTSNGTIDGQKGIVGARIDSKSATMLEPLRILSHGVTQCATEAPHLYKKDGWYYLVISEGGTEYGHHVNVLRSKDIYGPYQENPNNPILSNVFEKGNPIQATGHADLCRTADGRWFAVFLAIRLYSKAHLHNLGRETFLTDVEWVDGWPVIGNAGVIDCAHQAAMNRKVLEYSMTISFSERLETYPFLKVRSPKPECYKLGDNTLTLVGEERLTAELGRPTLLALRQRQFLSRFEATIELSALEGKAGVVAWYNSDYFLCLKIRKDTEHPILAEVVSCVHGFEAVVARKQITGHQERLLLSCTTDTERYTFWIEDKMIGSAPVASLCTETTMYMTFTGVLLGIFAEEGSATFHGSLQYTDWL